MSEEKETPSINHALRNIESIVKIVVQPSFAIEKLAWPKIEYQVMKHPGKRLYKYYFALFLEDDKSRYGSFLYCFTFYVDDFDKAEIPEHFEYLDFVWKSMCIGSLRGLIWHDTQATFLNGYVLPPINTQQEIKKVFDLAEELDDENVHLKLKRLVN